MDQIFVTNNNDFDHFDRYNGQDYAFPKGEKVLVEVQAARLFFGFQNPDKNEAMVRQGWATPTADDPNGERGVEYLKNFVFTRGVMVEEPVADAPAVEESAQP